MIGVTAKGIPCGLKFQAKSKTTFKIAYIQSNVLEMAGFLMKKIKGNKSGNAQMTFMFFSVTPWSVNNQRPKKNQPAMPKIEKNILSKSIFLFPFLICQKV